MATGMKRIIVADDEAVQRNVLCKIVSKICTEAVVTSCSNGKEVYEQLGEGSVDLILTDICMPVMDGMELIQKVANEFPKTKIILISAYQEFEYARNALKCNVTDYLLKPFRVSDVRKIIEKINTQINLESEKENNLSHYTILIDDARKQEKEELLKNLLNGKVEKEFLRREEFQPLNGFGIVVVIRWKIAQIHNRNSGCAGLTERQQKILLERIEFLFPQGFIVNTRGGLNTAEQKIVILVPEMSSAEVFHKLEYSLNQFSEEGIIFWAGLSNSKPSLIEFVREARNQAEEMLVFCFYTWDQGGIFNYEKMNGIMELPMVLSTSFEKEIRQAVCKGEEERTEFVLEQIKKELYKEPRRYPSKVKHRVSSMIVSILKELEGVIGQNEYDKMLNQAYEEYAECDSFYLLFEISKRLLLQAARYYHSTSRDYDAVEECIVYMKQHLEEDLSLQRVAEIAHFHPNYLSSQIKNRLGLSYSSFIQNIRMELACKLLKQTDKQIQEVAVKCGFKDSSYFNRVFKREYGCSPEKYRKVHKYVE